MPPHKRDRQSVHAQLAVSMAITIVLLAVLIAVKGSQSIVIAFPGAAVALLGIVRFMNDVWG